MHIIYLFCDGIGFGPKNRETNPFTRYATSYLSALGGKSSAELLPNCYIWPIDAQMGVEGLPQSATGQTALWTGVNAPHLMGRHMTAFPGPTLVPVIHEYSILKKLKEAGLRADFLNAYSDSYCQRMLEKPRMRSVSSHLQLSIDQAYKSFEDLEEGRALYMDYTYEVLHKLYPELKSRFPIQKTSDFVQKLLKIATRHDLVIHEFFISDKAGHGQSWEMAEWSIKVIEGVLNALMKDMDPEKYLLLLTSDHGNMEDLSVKTHTSNPVPCLAFGKHAKLAREKIKSLIDIPRFIYEILDIKIDFPHHIKG